MEIIQKPEDVKYQKRKKDRMKRKSWGPGDFIIPKEQNKVKEKQKKKDRKKKKHVDDFIIGEKKVDYFTLHQMEYDKYDELVGLSQTESRNSAKCGEDLDNDAKKVSFNSSLEKSELVSGGSLIFFRTNKELLRSPKSDQKDPLKDAKDTNDGKISSVPKIPILGKSSKSSKSPRSPKTQSKSPRLSKSWVQSGGSFMSSSTSSLSTVSTGSFMTSMSSISSTSSMSHISTESSVSPATKSAKSPRSPKSPKSPGKILSTLKKSPRDITEHPVYIGGELTGRKIEERWGLIPGTCHGDVVTCGSCKKKFQVGDIYIEKDTYYLPCGHNYKVVVRRATDPCT